MSRHDEAHEQRYNQRARVKKYVVIRDNIK